MKQYNCGCDSAALWDRFSELHHDVLHFIDTIKDGPGAPSGKSFEGQMEVRFCFPECYSSRARGGCSSVTIVLNSYLLGTQSYVGKTFEEALSNAEVALRAMID